MSRFIFVKTCLQNNMNVMNVIFFLLVFRVDIDLSKQQTDSEYLALQGDDRVLLLRGSDENDMKWMHVQVFVPLPVSGFVFYF